ncbi:hypothetical protein NW754_010290 [Fusarium falciforme]|nr:hypothetical protein NW754_010290 [Fusarium falciforme]
MISVLSRCAVRNTAIVTTQEFCGNKKVHRKSCPKTNGTPRVVGYYEGWAKNRPCNVFWPEQIPTGLYTHINFAFATIDPKTFKVGPSAQSDIALIKRLMLLKKKDPDLKIFVAIGGWAFNDPGPTATTFSDLAASVPRQKIFMQSLISFMSTYGFDGVDLDWEYPVDKDRFGREVDFDNFPKFMSRLKATLDSANKGLTITIPASYWYLQHFDIVKLAKSVDFFNIMSYDLHGLWDQDKKWTGSYLNAHTNLTEIDLALDLLWRNDIDPGQVVLGLGFYGRAFTAANKSCMEPGCMFASGGERGDCSREVGVLLNSEIDAIVKKHSITPKLYRREAVKVATWGDQWVAYDDEETFKLKSEFAQSRCLGRLMVWAISHDTKEVKYNLALAAVASRKIRGSGSGEDAYKQVDIPNDQCKWTDCQQSCPKGWIHMDREDSSARKGEKMLDETGCGGEGTHSFCCPPSSKLPTCGWYGHGNGNCKSSSSCPEGTIEIGSNNMYCKKKNKYQAACCTADTKNMRLYSTCSWGPYPDCDAQEQCPNPSTQTLVAKSYSGSGGGQCDWLVNKLGEEYGISMRKYCCDTSKDKIKFSECKEYKAIGPEPANAPLGFCRSGCPQGRVRVAMDAQPLACADGALSTCCIPSYSDTLEVENPKLQEFRDALSEYIETPMCTNPGPLLEKRGSSAEDLFSLEASDASGTTSLDVFELFPREVDNGSKKAAEMLFMILAAGVTNAMMSMMMEIWNATVGKLFRNLRMPGLRDYVQDQEAYEQEGPREMSHNIVCHPGMWDARIEAEKDGGSNTTLIDCSTEFCPYEGECEDPDADPPEGPEEVTKRSPDNGRQLFQRHRRHHGVHEHYHQVFKRAARRIYDQRITHAGEGTVTVSYMRSAYDEEKLLGDDDSLRDDALTFVDRRDCTNTRLRRVHVNPNPLLNPSPWDLEHLVDPSRIAAFILDASNGRLPSGTVSRFGRVTISFFQAARTMPLGPNVPALPGGANPPRLFDRVGECLGSRTNRDNIVILNVEINRVKNYLMRFKAPIREGRWEYMANNVGRIVDRSKVLERIRNAIAMIHYLNRREGVDVNTRLTNIVNNIETQLRHWGLWNEQHPDDQTRIADFWRQWALNQFEHLVTHTQQWANAPGAVQVLNSLEAELATLIVDTSRFRQPPPQ